MSAFLVDPCHVDLLIGYAIDTAGDTLARVEWSRDGTDPLSREWGTLDRDALIEWEGVTLADEAAREMLRANLASVRARYPDGYQEMGYDLDAQAHRYTDRGYVLSDAEAVRACDCFEYQACEHDGWADSEACRLVDAIRTHAVDRLVGAQLAREWGVVSPPWEWSPDVIQAALAVHHAHETRGR